MSIRIGQNIISGAGQTRFIEQPATGEPSVAVNARGIVRTTAGVFFWNVSGVSQNVDFTTVIVDTDADWSEIGAGSGIDFINPPVSGDIGKVLQATAVNEVSYVDATGAPLIIVPVASESFTVSSLQQIMFAINPNLDSDNNVITLNPPEIWRNITSGDITVSFDADLRPTFPDGESIREYDGSSDNPNDNIATLVNDVWQKMGSTEEESIVLSRVTILDGQIGGSGDVANRIHIGGFGTAPEDVVNLRINGEIQQQSLAIQSTTVPDGSVTGSVGVYTRHSVSGCLRLTDVIPGTQANLDLLSNALQPGDIGTTAIRYGDEPRALTQAFVGGTFNLDTDHVQVNDVNGVSFSTAVVVGERIEFITPDGEENIELTIAHLFNVSAGSTLVAFDEELPASFVQGLAIRALGMVIEQIAPTGNAITVSLDSENTATINLVTTVVDGAVTEVGGLPLSAIGRTTFISSQAEANAIGLSAADGQLITIEGGGSYQVSVFRQLQYGPNSTPTDLGEGFLPTDVYLTGFGAAGGSIGTNPVFTSDTSRYNIQINFPDNPAGSPNTSVGRYDLLANGVAVNLNAINVRIAVRQNPTDQWMIAGQTEDSSLNGHEGRIRIARDSSSEAAFGTDADPNILVGACLGLLENVTLASGLSYVWNQEQGRFDPVTPSTRTVSELPGGPGGQSSTPSYDDTVEVQDGDIIFLQGDATATFGKDIVPTGLWRYRFISQLIQGWVALGKSDQYNNNIIYGPGEVIFNDVNGTETPFRAIIYTNDWNATGVFQPSIVVGFTGLDGNADIAYYRWSGTAASTATDIPGVATDWVLTFRPFHFGVAPGEASNSESYWDRLNPYVGELLEEVEDGIRVENRSGNGDAFTGTREVIDFFNDPATGNNATPSFWRFTETEDEQDATKIASMVEVIAGTKLAETSLQPGDIGITAIRYGDDPRALTQAFVSGSFNFVTDEVQVNDVNSVSFSTDVVVGERVEFITPDGEENIELTIAHLFNVSAGSTLVAFDEELPAGFIAGLAIRALGSVIEQIARTGNGIRVDLDNENTASINLVTTLRDGDISEIGGVTLSSGEINFKDFGTFSGGVLLFQREVLRLPSFERAFVRTANAPATIDSDAQTEAELLALLTGADANDYQEIQIGPEVTGGGGTVHDQNDLADGVDLTVGTGDLVIADIFSTNNGGKVFLRIGVSININNGYDFTYETTPSGFSTLDIDPGWIQAGNINLDANNDDVDADSQWARNVSMNYTELNLAGDDRIIEPGGIVGLRSAPAGSGTEATKFMNISGGPIQVQRGDFIVSDSDNTIIDSVNATTWFRLEKLTTAADSGLSIDPNFNSIVLAEDVPRDQTQTVTRQAGTEEIEISSTGVISLRLNPSTHTRDFGPTVLTVSPSRSEQSDAGGNTFDLTFTGVTTGFTYNFDSASSDDASFTTSIINSGQTIRAVDSDGTVVSNARIHVVYTTTDTQADPDTVVPNQTISTTLSVTAIPPADTQSDFFYFGTLETPLAPADPAVDITLANIAGSDGTAVARSTRQLNSNTGFALNSVPTVGDADETECWIAVIGTASFIETSPGNNLITNLDPQGSTIAINGENYTLYRAYITENSTFRINIA